MRWLAVLLLITACDGRGCGPAPEAARDCAHSSPPDGAVAVCRAECRDAATACDFGECHVCRFCVDSDSGPHWGLVVNDCKRPLSCAESTPPDNAPICKPECLGDAAVACRLAGCSVCRQCRETDAGPVWPLIVNDCHTPDAHVPDGDAGVPDAPIPDATVPDARTSCGPPPADCAGRCLTHVDNFMFASCCDSTTCNCPPSTMIWEEWSCDPAPRADAGP